MPHVPGAYMDRPNPEDTQVEVPAVLVRPPQPGEESVGPALTPLVLEVRRAVEALEALWRQARLEALERFYTDVVNFQTDANGDAAAMLFQVPQGATGYLMLCGIDQAGVTPAAPNTSANLWHGVYAGQAGLTRLADVVRVGALLDASPLSPAADAQIPFVYKYSDVYGAPALVGPLCFYVVIDAATADRQHSTRWNVLVRQPEP